MEGESSDRCLCSCVPYKQPDCPYTIGGKQVQKDTEWKWSKTHKTPRATLLTHDALAVFFHPEFSWGNAVVRGDTPFQRGSIYFWEISVLGPVYGSSVMVGVGTDKTDVNKYQYDLDVEALGADDESYGLNYKGQLRHNGQTLPYHRKAKFTRGTLIGVCLDMFRGTLEYYINRRPLGIAFTGLQTKTLYPMLSSTASRSSMILCYATSHRFSLLTHALKQLKTRHVDKLPWSFQNSLKGCWWFFPKLPKQKHTKRHSRKRKHNFGGIIIMVHNTIQQNEEEAVLGSRMQSVLENSESYLVADRYGRKRNCSNSDQ